MRIKIAFVVLFTAWFSSQALAQWNWQYPAPPPPPPLPPSVDQPDSSKERTAAASAEPPGKS